MFISVVVNFYNSERFIPKLLESVFNQSFSDWELVCVVDASPGRDVEVIKQVTAKHGMEHKVRIIVNPVNLGISKSKKVGIDEARGKYITFADGDDFFAPDAFAEMARPALDHDVDYVNMNYARLYPVANRRLDLCVPLPDSDYGRVMFRDEFFDRFFLNSFEYTGLGYPYWAKLYRASLLKNLDFDYPAQGDTVAEDKWFNMAVCQQIGSAVFVKYIGYFWRWGGISSVRTDSSWSMTREFEKHVQYFAVQRELIDRYNYQKAWLPLVRTLKYKLMEALFDLASHKPGAKRAQAVVEYIAKCFDMPPVGHIAELADTCPEDEKPLIQAFALRDAQAVYNYAHKIYKSRWKYRASRRVLNCLLKLSR